MMMRKTILTGGLYGLLTSLVVMAFSYLGYTLLSLPFLPFDLFDWLARSLPPALLEAAVRSMVSGIAALGVSPLDAAAKLLEQILALIIVALVGAVFGWILGWVGLRQRSWLIRCGWLGGLLLWGGMLRVETALPSAPVSPAGLAWLLALLLAWGAVLALLIRQKMRKSEAAAQPAADRASRRSFLILAGSSLAGLAVLVLGLGRSRLSRAALLAAAPGKVGPASTSGPAVSPSQAVLDRRTPAAPATRAEVTPIASFYRVDINTEPPHIDAASWRMAVSGLVDHPREFSLDELRAFPPVTQAATLACISNPIGGKLISTTYWSGVRFRDLLAAVGVQPAAKDFNVMAADGYYEPLSLAEALDERTLLVYAMDGQPLLPEHGFPLRIFIPGHYGLRQPKWITAIVATNKHGLGFWLETSSPATASAIDTAVFDRAQLTPDGKLPLGGIAWAADRGIRKVELQIDNGDWVEAQLRTPTLSPLTWVQWRYDWKAVPGSHLLRVRATDGAGALQEAQNSDTTGHGATGLDTVNIKI